MNDENTSRENRSQSFQSMVFTLFNSYPRTCWVALVCGLAMPLYFPINAYTDRSRAIALAIPWDHSISLSVGWIYVYTLVYMSAFFPLLVVRSSKLVHCMAASFLTTFAIAYLCFLVLPVTTVPIDGPALRPEFAVLDDSYFTGWVLCLNYYLDPPNNCFPSLHIAMAFVAAYSTYKADKLYGGLAIVAAVLISISTMLVKQHYLADVVAGLLLAAFSSYLFLWSYQPESDDPLEIRFPRRYGLILILVWLVAVSIVFSIYSSGYRPWR
jgi:membrane-associated phospholipid phosphatase